ncbi:MAG: phytoene desaturase [Rhodocyclaceae bacterium]|nr:phytoene desaturase [Rhodocyclaceae bacterium]MCA3020448.1 phytoene desaturase [Rhodocyclaceae bacterium]MCA3020827.1 phytoene desaturase [Rhodocyclaceae bacterium]MCA3024498.1 phytoene desaturase [Rhodocyclaceae bacterium]MCA3030500.1 phytoene desaturase [Rhodocyclaceae bacterium]
MMVKRVVVIGAGMGGLAAAADLARQGFDVEVLERASSPGGKMREVKVGESYIDAGPTVFTMKWVFESLFHDAGSKLEEFLELQTASILARHAWRNDSHTGSRLDLFADIEQSTAAIADFAGGREADGYRAFCKRGADIYRTLRDTYMAAQRPSPFELVQRVGIGNLGAMWRTAPMKTLWAELGNYFHDPRLRQLFGRYATYVGSSPGFAPATLMLIAHVEQEGVWIVKGGMRRVADALQQLGEKHGVRFRFNTHVDEIQIAQGRVAGARLAGGEILACDAVVFNGDISALGTGLLGAPVTKAAKPIARKDRSLSAVTWCVSAKTRGFPLHHHNVFFAEDYLEEFDAVFRRRTVTAAPTVYVCAQDRADAAVDQHIERDSDRMLVLINAPADGDVSSLSAAQIATLQESAFGLMRQCGLEIDVSTMSSVATPPEGFNALFPATGGALYGRANHGSMASFARPGATSGIRGLYLAGGSAHPGAGIPMATISGRLAAQRVVADLGS